MLSGANREQPVPWQAAYFFHTERRLGLPLRLLLLVLFVLSWQESPPLRLGVLLIALTVAVSALFFLPRVQNGPHLEGFTLAAFLVETALAGATGLSLAASPAVRFLVAGLVSLHALALAPLTPLPLVLAFGFWLAMVAIPSWRAGHVAISPLEGAAAVIFLGTVVVLARTFRQAVLEGAARRRELAALRARTTQAETALRHTADQLARELLALRAIQRRTRDTSSTEPLEKLLTLVAEITAQTIGESSVLIGLARDASVELVACSHPHPATVEQAVLHLMRQAIAENTLVERPPTAALGGPVIVTPLIAEGEPAGALALLGLPTRSSFRADEVERLHAFADQASIAIAQARLSARLMESQAHAESRLAQLEALSAVARTFVSSLDTNRLLADFVRQLAAVVPFTHAAIFLYDETGFSPQPAFCMPPGDELPLRPDEVPEVMRALRQGDLVQILDRQRTSEPTAKFIRQWGVKSSLVIPLISRQQPVGVLLVGHAHADMTINTEEAQLITSLASFAAAAVDNLRLYGQLSQKSRQLAAIVRDIGDGVIVADAQLRLLLVNPAARTIFGLESSPLEDHPLAEVIPLPALADLCRSALASAGEPQMAELHVRQAGGRDRTYQALATAVGHENGTPWGVVTVMRDITAQKELERMKTNFLSVISHELRTPLHSIGGFVDVILMGKTGPINELQRDFLETVKEQAQHLYQLIEDLLEFNRLESGQFQLSLTPVEIGTLLREVTESMFPVADERRIHLVNTVAVPTATVEGDRKRLRQVFTNLIDNALKFTPAGGSVTVSAETTPNAVVVRVRDTGIGIPKEEQERIFERFYQVDSGLTREHRGTGLGLAIAKHIIEQHGGRIWVESEVNRGSTFFVSLPYTQPRERPTLDLARLPSSRR